jgi:hypothetical protein
MDTIASALAELSFGKAQTFRNLTLFPLIGTAPAEPGYLTLDEALERRVARVTEVSESGTVPELRFDNGALQPVLLVDGEELVGAKQNRVLNLTILVGGGKSVRIPVSCVEQGRWAYRSREFSGANRNLFAKARAKKMARVSVSLACTGSRRGDQGEVWSDIQVKFSRMCEASPSMAVGDLYEARSTSIQSYVGAFKAAPLQRGAVFAVDGKVVGLDLFDAPATFAKLLEKLVTSYAVDALERETDTQTPSEAAVRQFLERMKAAVAEKYPAIAEGEDVRLSAPGLSGGALVSDGRLVHLAAFEVTETAGSHSTVQL